MTAPITAEAVSELERFHADCEPDCPVRRLVAGYREQARAVESLRADNLRLINLAAASRQVPA